MNTKHLTEALNSASITSLFGELYGNDNKTLDTHKKRYMHIIEAFEKRFNEEPVRLCSSPGRSEIGGNHTDHNLGKVLAASIQLDCIGAVKATDDNTITIYDTTYNEDFMVNLGNTARITGEKGSIALVRGILQGFKNKGFSVGGFKACFSTTVIAAAGVSSSASFEMILCTILNALYNQNRITTADYASIGQFAENAYWDKASGLLDQTACAVGGLIAIDFKNPLLPEVEKIPFDFAKEQYRLLIVNTGKSHADLSAEYSSIPNEMKAVARFFGKEALRGVSFTDIIAVLPEIRRQCGDRSVMRSFHFIEENSRVDEEVATLKRNDFASFLTLITESGNSSWKWLQNTYIVSDTHEQSIPMALALSEHFIRTHGCGACRIHGGGFAGVIQTFLPQTLAQEYTTYMNKALEADAVYDMAIRPYGSMMIV